MEIAKIKISNKLMALCVTKLFIEDKINYERKLENSYKQSITQINIPNFFYDINIKIPICKKDINKYIEETNNKNNWLKYGTPYFSLISSNSTNELKIYIKNIASDYTIIVNDIASKSLHYIYNNDNKKYSFD